MPGGRKLTEPHDISADPPREGVVIRAGGGSCRVAIGGVVHLCRVRGRLKQGRQLVQNILVVGDRVLVQALPAAAEDAEPEGVVEDVLPRRNRISRQAARRAGGGLEQVLIANLDQVVAVQSVGDPAPQTGFVDRLLVAAASFGVTGVLCLNKCDLDAELAGDPRWDYYTGLGVEVLRTSATTGEGLAALRARMRDRLSIFLGASGVGKSTLLNAIQPGLRLRTTEVTGRTGLGRHTTTHTELFPLRDGGFVADSPGLRGFDPWDIAPEDLRDQFPDFTEPAAGCRFRTCMHRDEPDCMVKRAVATGTIPGWRHDAYLDLLRDLEERRNQASPYRR
jgi:ribosome biogenesis GTPase